MELFKKSAAEFVGTFILVFVGCGAATVVGTAGAGYLITALAFGLGLMAAAYGIGGVSGCHVNPAVTFALFVKGDVGLGRFFAYLAAQTLGAFSGAGALALIVYLSDLKDQTGAFGSNSLDGVNGSAAAGLTVELLLTFVFVLSILGVTAKKENGGLSGAVIACSLTAVHLVGIGLTGTSVNPARSIGPALVSAFSGNVGPLGQVWVFVIAPFAGAGLAALVFLALTSRGQKAEKTPDPAGKDGDESADGQQ